MNNIPYKYDGRYIINDTLSRMCQMLNSEEFIEKIINSTQLPYLFTNNPIPLEFNSASIFIYKQPYTFRIQLFAI